MITVHFYKQDQDGLIAIEVNEHITLKRAQAKRYREIGLIKIAYERQPISGPNPENIDFDMLTCALEYRTAFTTDEFLGRFAENLAAGGLGYIANAIATALKRECKGSGVILFDLEDKT